MGRPTDLTPETQARLCEELAKGNRRIVSARIAGVPPATFFRWCAKGRAGEATYREFWEAIKRAEDEAESHMVGIIRTAAIKSWQAAAWWVERRRGKQWHSPELKAKAKMPESHERPSSPEEELAFARRMKAAAEADEKRLLEQMGGRH